MIRIFGNFIMLRQNLAAFEFFRNFLSQKHFCSV